MVTYLLFLASALGTDPQVVFANVDARWTTSIVPTVRPAAEAFVLDQDTDRPIFRGQSIVDQPEGMATYESYGFWDSPFVQEFISSMNPFVPEDVHTIHEYYDPFGFQMETGSCGPPGYRLGWTTYNDITFLPSSGARGTPGSMQITEWNSYLKYSHVVAPGVIFNGTGYFSARWWEGPSAIPVPGQVDQISTDIEFGFFNGGPWSAQVAFHPQIVMTYEARLDKNAFNFDGRAIATYRASPAWSFVMGGAIWDRVDLMVVPHGRVVWTPDDRWEFRILYPRSRISYFLGNFNGADTYLYGVAEYTAEAWQSVDKETGSSDRIQLTDDRLSGGIRWDANRYSLLVEGGFVFNRQIKFEGSYPSFDLNNGGMIRVGLRY